MYVSARVALTLTAQAQLLSYAVVQSAAVALDQLADIQYEA